MKHILLVAAVSLVLTTIQHFINFECAVITGLSIVVSYLIKLDLREY